MRCPAGAAAAVRLPACLLSRSLSLAPPLPLLSLGDARALARLALVRAQLGAEDVGNVHAEAALLPEAAPSHFTRPGHSTNFPPSCTLVAPAGPFGSQLRDSGRLCSQPHPQWSPPTRNCLCPGASSVAARRVAGNARACRSHAPQTAGCNGGRQAAGRCSSGAPRRRQRPHPTLHRPVQGLRRRHLAAWRLPKGRRCLHGRGAWLQRLAAALQMSGRPQMR